MTLPAVFLQLPTNYVDVAAASFLLAAAVFVLARPTPRTILLAGVALGLFLGSKPNAPIGATLMFAVPAARGLRAGHRLPLVAAAACVLALGAETYVTNFLRHGNPIWPVEARLGPLSLPGPVPMDDVLTSGAAAPRLSDWGPLRVLRSWTALAAPPAFDMRYGGLGVVFLASLPLAAIATARRRSLAHVAALAAALASPDPAVARYVLALPGLTLALAAPRLSVLRRDRRRLVHAALALAALVALVHAYPGLAGEGPPLSSYGRMSALERASAVGADGSPRAFLEAHARVRPYEWTAFDASLDLPYLAWPPDLSHRALWISDDGDEAAVERIVHDPSIRMLIVGDLTRTAFLAQSHFRRIFHCKSASCTVYLRR